MLHNLKHNQVLHERVLIVTVKVEEVPQVVPEHRTKVHDAGCGFYRVIIRCGFMDEVDIPRELSALGCLDGSFDPMATSYFLGRQKLIPSVDHPGMARWREGLFAWMSKSSESAMESLQAAHQPGGRTGQPVADLTRAPRRHGTLQSAMVRTLNAPS